MKRILIVEDDLVITKIWQMLLQGKGVQVDNALNGETAIDKLKRTQPDLVLLDLMLPRISGLEVLKFVRSQPATQATPVFVLTNSCQSNMVKAAWEAGATKCLFKADCSLEQLWAEVCSHLAIATDSEPPKKAELPGKSPERVPATGGSMRTIETSADLALFQAEVRQTFLHSGPQTLVTLRNQLQSFIRNDTPEFRHGQILDLCRTAHALTTSAGLARFHRIAQMAGALETLLRELHEEPVNINPSSMRTMALAVDFLSTLFNYTSQAEPDDSPTPLIMVVDDELISRWTVCSALELANLKPISLEDPNLALAVLKQNQFDLIILDVGMPGKSGFELCTELRALSTNVKTPVIFVTGMTDFEVRARSTLSGGNDFIAKPFLLVELAVKALIFLIQGQIKAATKPA